MKNRMRFLVAAGFLMTVGAAWSAEEPKGVLQCKPNMGYMHILKPFSVNLSDKHVLGNMAEGQEWVVAWSESECEDSTDLRFALADFQKLVDGQVKTASAELHHSEPDAEIKANYDCSIKKD